MDDHPNVLFFILRIFIFHLFFIYFSILVNDKIYFIFLVYLYLMGNN